MLFGRNKEKPSFNVMVDGKPIESSPAHISDVCKKTSKKIGVLARMRNMLPMQAKLQLYKSAILPYLTYCHTVWHFCCASDARKLERIQERALRAVFADRTATYEELLNKASLPSLRLQAILILMYKVKHSLASEHICNLFL